MNTAQRPGSFVSAHPKLSTEYVQALEAFTAQGNEFGAASVLDNLAELEFTAGHVEQALRFAGQAREIFTREKRATNLAINYINDAAYRIALGDVDGARTAVREGLRYAQQEQNAFHIAIASQHLALLGALRGLAHIAACIIGYVDISYVLVLFCVV